MTPGEDHYLYGRSDNNGTPTEKDFWLAKFTDHKWVAGLTSSLPADLKIVAYPCMLRAHA